MTARVLCIGDVMLDVITKIAVMPDKINYGSDTPSKISTHGGGAAGNVASWLTRTDAQATIVGHVGDDAAGAALMSEFDALGVHHENLMVDSGSSGVVVVLVDPTGERTMFPDNGANSGLHIVDLPALDGYDAVYLSGYSPLDPLSRPGVLEMITKIRAAGIPLYFDSKKGASAKGAPFGARLIGTKGVLSLQIDEEPLVILERDGKKIPVTTAGIGQAEPIQDIKLVNGGHHGAVLDLLAAIAEKREPVCGPEAGRETIEMTTAVFASFAAGGKKISLPQADRQHPLR